MIVSSLFSSLALLSLAPQIAAQAWTGIPGSIYGPLQSWSAPNWPPSDVGQPLVPQKPDAELKAMLASIDPNRIKDIVTTLANFGTRHTLSSQTDPKRGIGAARNWILARMRDIAKTSGGNMDVQLQSYIQPVAERISFPVNISNIVATVKGTSDPNRVYVVTGHYDSRRIDIMDYTNDAPGADDDASGVAVVMEMARICARKRPAATMIFAAVGAEEQNLYGSNYLAQSLKNASANVEGHWNNDIVGTGSFEPYSPVNPHTVRLYGASLFYPNASSGALLSQTALIGGENDSPARNLGRFVSEIAAGARREVDMQVALIYRPDRFLRGGDHESFLQQGFPAVRFTEAVENFAHQHQDPRVQDGVQYGDLVEYVDFDYVAKVARVNLASMWSAANAPAMPKNVTISEVTGFPASSESTPLEIISNDSLLKWQTGNDPLVAAYEVVWRPNAALQWTHTVMVGNVSQATLTLSKDNVQFGVRAVGKNGKRSPAVFPLPSR